MEILYADATLLVASKPPRVLSTDEPGGMPDLLRQALGDPAANVRTVHRLDRVVGGAMVFARTKRAARELSAQITDGGFGKRYLAIVHGAPTPPAGRMEDELWRDKARRMTFAMPTPGPETQHAALDYRILAMQQGKSLMAIVAACIKCGDEVEVQCSGADEDAALEEAIGMIESGFGEE